MDRYYPHGPVEENQSREQLKKEGTESGRELAHNRQLLFNTVKHAGVNAARVELESMDNARIRLTVRDSGKGFDTGILHQKDPSNEGFSLFSIQERLHTIGGRSQIENPIGSGSRFTLIGPKQHHGQEKKEIGMATAEQTMKRGKPDTFAGA